MKIQHARTLSLSLPLSLPPSFSLSLFISVSLTGEEGVQIQHTRALSVPPGNTKGGSITVALTSYLTGLDWSVLQIKTKIVSCHAADSKPVKQEVNSTVILPP
jgi:hypothetical protein